MKLDTSHTFSSKYHNIVLIATELEEPNYGRFHWKYHFLINEVLIENQHMNYKYGGLFGDLTNFCLESKDGNYIFLPIVNTPLIYEPKKDSYFEIPGIAQGKNNQFLKNIFTNDRLIVLCERSFQIVNLINKSIQNVIFPIYQYQLKDITYDNQLYISYLDLKNFDENKGYYDFDSMTFKNIEL